MIAYILTLAIHTRKSFLKNRQRAMIGDCITRLKTNANILNRQPMWWKWLDARTVRRDMFPTIVHYGIQLLTEVNCSLKEEITSFVAMEKGMMTDGNV